MASDLLSKLSGEQNLLLGMASGCMAKMCNYPFLSWKNAVQQGLAVSLNPAVVYRGLPMGLVNFGGTTAVQFGLTGFFQKLLFSSSNMTGHTVQLSGAFLGGLVSGIPCSIWELCMIQQQRHGGSMLGTPARFVREYGITTLTRGFTMTMGRESMFTLSMLGVTPMIQGKLVETSGLEKNTALAVGALTGASLAGTITHPMDTIKTCMQGDLERIKYTNVLSSGRSLISEYGLVQGLFKGLHFRIGLISTSFFLVNFFKQRLAPMMFPSVARPQPSKLTRSSSALGRHLLLPVCQGTGPCSRLQDDCS
eukprot:TRINITY_DN88154_c0_g1_i1.p1 TRINITY_DN88154_c0_g1~~TRINITY_DN88154_c0_g1_i1.p1  ORF type:complete len:308 (+),score=43.71 TRINITY_DN88154_c0_g1_i1:62-985(+)